MSKQATGQEREATGQAGQDGTTRTLSKGKAAKFNGKAAKPEKEKGKTARHGVTICTVHAAKGLEWQVVFAMHWCDGYLPTYPRKKKMTAEGRVSMLDGACAEDTSVDMSVSIPDGSKHILWQLC